MTEFASHYETLLLRRERSRLHVTLNRPQVKNALNSTLIGELRAVFGILREEWPTGWVANNPPMVATPACFDVYSRPE